MALKQKIDKAVFDALSADVQKEYKAAGVGTEAHYVLDVEGYEDPGELRRARDREKQAAADAKKEAQTAKDALAELQRTGARGTGDIAALEKSWKETSEAHVATEKAKTKVREKQLTKLLRDDVALQLAAKISTAPTLLTPHIAGRIRVEIPEDDGDPITRVLDKAGKPTALTVAELGAEFVADKEFAAIIIGSKASGGGASGNQSGGATKKPNEMTGAERTALYRSNPAEHDRLFPPQL